MVRSWKQIAGGILAALVLVYLGLYWADRPSFTYEGPPKFESFEAYLAERLAESRRKGVRPGNDERLVRVAPGKTKHAILFLHGFGASRAEGEAVFDPLAKELGTNLYYLRLPGHGTNMEDHAATTFEEYLRTAEDAFAMMPFLGERFVLAGSSTGAMIATYLAAKYPDRVQALILTSPFYAFKDPTAQVILALPGGLGLIETLYGDVRDAEWKSDPEKRRMENYEKFWLTKQKYAALKPLNKLRRFVARPSVYRQVTSPVLLLYYYRDEKHQDTAVEVRAMLEAFSEFGRMKQANPLNRAVPIADGNHILLSRYVRTDKALIKKEIRSFLGQALQ